MVASAQPFYSTTTPSIAMEAALSGVHLPLQGRPAWDHRPAHLSPGAMQPRPCMPCKTITPARVEALVFCFEKARCPKQGVGPFCLTKPDLMALRSWCSVRQPSTALEVSPCGKWRTKGSPVAALQHMVEEMCIWGARAIGNIIFIVTVT